MSHNFLLDTYAFITQRLAAAHELSKDAGEDDVLKQHAAGRMEALRQFECFLSDHYDVKLPRRIARERKRSKIQAQNLPGE